MAEGQRKQNRKRRDRERREKHDKGKDATRLARLSSEQLQHLYDQLGDIVPNWSGCLLTERSLNAQGYVASVSVGKRRQQGEWDNADFRPDFPFVATQVVLAYNGRFAANKTDEASHLCHRRACLNIDHLVWESRQANEARKNCVGRVFCRECHQWLQLCTHEPKCIKLTHLP